MEYLEIGARRDAYSVDDVIERTLTVGELIEILEEYEEDTPVILSHDGGYTYGALHEGRITLESAEDEEEVGVEEEEVEADDTFDESWSPDNPYDEDDCEGEEEPWDYDVDDHDNEPVDRWKRRDWLKKKDGKVLTAESVDEGCLHCDGDEDDDDIECDDDFGEHENSRDLDEVYSFKGLNDNFGGKTLAESLRPRAIKRKKK